jgi:hypothetical protein
MTAGSAGAAIAPATTYPAQWISHDFIIELGPNAQAYTCNQLYYKFSYTLRAIGAYTKKVMPYQCAQTAATAKPGAPAPKVEVQFRWPNRLTPAQAKWADFQAVVKTVEIAPGAVPSIAAQDCRLVRRINTELLQPLGVNIVKAAFDCEAQHPTFDLVVKVDEALLKMQAVNKGVATR